MRLTNVVVQGKLDHTVDLQTLANALTNVRYDPLRFSGLLLHHRKIGGHCKVFASGAIQCNGKCTSFQEGIKRFRCYARLLQRKGFCNCLEDVNIITASACHRFDEIVRLQNIPFYYTYNPEVFPAIMFKRGGIHFTLHFSGAFLITGIKCSKDINEVIYPVILELGISL